MSRKSNVAIPMGQLSLVDDGSTVWRGRKVSVIERKRNAERAKEWRTKPENSAQFKKMRDQWMATNADHVRQRKAQYYQLNKDAVAVYAKERYLANKDHIKAAVAVGKLYRKYKLTPIQRAEMEVSQQGRCAICGIHASETPKSQLCVDHDHQTGSVRALLCDNCNVGLGRFNDNPDSLRAAAAYIQEHKRGVA